MARRSTKKSAQHQYSDSERDEDVKALHGMGYAQELERSMSKFSNFAISFSIICIVSGGINSLGQATSGAGGAAIGIGWPVGVAVSGIFVLGLAQIPSAYPTAGGLYHWGSILGRKPVRTSSWSSAMRTRITHPLCRPRRSRESAGG